jgi:2-polyprenyl-3-methyl-5-hydroxy-6-metoxy-1,4-benzoquinol methylase
VRRNFTLDALVSLPVSALVVVSFRVAVRFRLVFGRYVVYSGNGSNVDLMAACTSCNLCDNPGTLEQAVDKGLVMCHVRHFAGDAFTVWRCANCNSLHSAENADLALYYAHYPLRNHRLDFPSRAFYRKRLRLLQKQGFRQPARILDYGCGTGAFVEFLKESGVSETFGYDPFISTYADRQVLREQYDVVVSYDVIEHSDAPKDFMSQVAELARPQGLIVIGTPNADYTSVRGEPADIELSQPYHRHILSEKSLLDLGRERGLRPLRVYHSNAIDSLIPGINTKFMWTYINNMGGMIDVAFEPMRMSTVLLSPTLLFYTFFGFFFPPRANMVIVFRRE